MLTDRAEPRLDRRQEGFLTHWRRSTERPQLAVMAFCAIEQLHDSTSRDARLSQHPKEDSFNFRVDPGLKADFQAATEAEDKPAAQVLRDFMRDYVARRRRQSFATEAERQSLSIAARVNDPSSDEAAMLHELDTALDDLAGEWK